VNQCKTCAFWGVSISLLLGKLDNLRTVENPLIRFCSYPTLTELNNPETLVKMGADTFALEIAEDDYTNRLITGAEFGCVKWEAGEEKKEAA